MVNKEELSKKARLERETIAIRCAKEFQNGMIVNLGVGIPTLASNFIPPGMRMWFHSENGVLGFGAIAALEEVDLALVNASGQNVTALPGISFFSHDESFAMIRGGHIDLCILGGLQVSEKGDLANWLMPNRKLGNIGGAMDLAFNAKKLIIAMEHVAKDGKPKIVKECNCSLTAPQCVDLVVTDIAVIEVSPKGLVLREVAPGWSADDVQLLTEPELIVAPDLKEIELL